MTIATGTNLGPYEIIAVLGDGGMGEGPRVSPDGSRVVIQRIDPQSQNQDIWMIDLARNLPTRLMTGLVQSGFEYDVTGDGQRFLIGTMVGDANATPGSVILNWTAEAKK